MKTLQEAAEIMLKAAQGEKIAYSPWSCNCKAWSLMISSTHVGFWDWINNDYDLASRVLPQEKQKRIVEKPIVVISGSMVFTDDKGFNWNATYATSLPNFRGYRFANGSVAHNLWNSDFSEHATHVRLEVTE